MKPTPIYTGAVGLDTVHDEDDIFFDPETGVSALAKAVNVKIEKSGSGRPRLSRCKGYALATAGVYDSGWSDGRDAFCRASDVLYRMNANGTFTQVRTGVIGRRLRFARHGELFYYSDGIDYGYIEGTTNHSWDIQTYVGPESMSSFSTAPVPRHLAVFNGRAYVVDVAEPDVVYWSEPTQLRLFNRAVNHRVIEKGSAIIMVAPVNSGEAGLFFSTESATYFMTGAPNVSVKQVANYPAIEDTVAQKKYSCRDLGLSMDGYAVLWRAKNGICAGLPNGSMINLTDAMVSAASIACAGPGASVLIGDLLVSTVGGSTIITNLAVGEAAGKKATTQRTNYAFNSYIDVAGRYYGLSASGVYILGGDTDAGTDIDAYITLGSTNLGKGGPKRSGYCYVTGEMAGSMYATITPNKDTTRSQTYSFTPATTEFHVHREKFGKGDRAENWGFTFGNVDGADFSIAKLEVLFPTGQRRLNQY